VESENAGCLLLPLELYPWTRPATLLEQSVGKATSCFLCRRNDEYESLLQLKVVGARSSRAAPGGSGPLLQLVLFLARFLTSSFPSQRCLYPLFLAGLQVEGVALDLLDDVFLLHLALEAA
jgi:hypothetical protein